MITRGSPSFSFLASPTDTRASGFALMPIDIIDPTQFPDWDSLILRHSEASFFHSAAWAMVLQRAYGFRPLYFTIFEGGLLSACLPVMEIDSFLTGRRGVSLPFSDYCEPLASSPEEFQELFTEATEYGKQHGWKSLELRGGGSFLDSHPSSSTYLLHTLDLTAGEKAVYAGIRESTRRAVKKARATGVRSRDTDQRGRTEEVLPLNQITRREHGLPPQPYRFFEEVHRHVISKGHGFVAMASQEAKSSPPPSTSNSAKPPFTNMVRRTSGTNTSGRTTSSCGRRSGDASETADRASP